jgi:hypothetical protein
MTECTILLSVFNLNVILLSVILLWVILSSVTQLNVILLMVGPLSVVLMNVIQLNAIILKVALLSVIRLSVILLNVVFHNVVTSFLTLFPVSSKNISTFGYFSLFVTQKEYFCQFSYFFLKYFLKKKMTDR